MGALWFSFSLTIWAVGTSHLCYYFIITLVWILNLAGWMDQYYSTQQFQQLQQQHHHYQLTSYLAASSNAAETDQTLVVRPSLAIVDSTNSGSWQLFRLRYLDMRMIDPEILSE